MSYREPDEGLVAEREEKQRADAEAVSKFQKALRRGRFHRGTKHDLRSLPRGCWTVPAGALVLLGGCVGGANLLPYLLVDSRGDFAGALGWLLCALAGGILGTAAAALFLFRAFRRADEQADR